MQRVIILKIKFKMQKSQVVRFECKMCPQTFNTSEGETVFLHTKHVHRCDLFFNAVCPVYQCNIPFYKFSSYLKHWYDKHGKGKSNYIYVQDSPECSQRDSTGKDIICSKFLFFFNVHYFIQVKVLLTPARLMKIS